MRTLLLSLWTTLSLSYTIVGTTQASQIPRDDFSSSFLCPSCLLKGPPQNCAIARNRSVNADFIITQRSTLSLFLERHWPSEAFLCPRGQSSRPSLCGLVFFFFSIIHRRPQGMGMRASSQKRVQKRVQRARAESNWVPEGDGRQVKSPKKFITFELRPYTTKPTASRPICAVKQLMAESVLWWGTTWEYSVL